jgi:hypothetical protein
MDYTRGTFAKVALLLTLASSSPAHAQFQRGTLRPNGLPTLHFTQAWQAALDQPVKLIDIAPVVGREQNLILLETSRDSHDARRTLEVTHWDGFRFTSDGSIDFVGRMPDALLVGHFHVPKPVVAVGTAATPQVSPKPKKRDSGPAPDEVRQIVTTDGVYQWSGKALSRLFGGPGDIKLEISRPGAIDQLVAGEGDNAQLFEVGDTDTHPVQVNPPGGGDGYARLGTGTQEFTDTSMFDFNPGVRFIQSYWTDRCKWVVGIAHGTPAPTKEEPFATTNDKIVLFVAQQTESDKSFWALKRDDFVESWRSDPLPGRVLDIRIGDPKNEGKPGILVLIADSNGPGRHLIFFTPVPPNGFQR